MINLSIRHEIRERALKNPEEEVCGLIILNKDNEYKVFHCKNISFNKKEHSILDPLDYIKASKLGKIVGMYHSQPNDGPSLIDNLSSDNFNLFSIIYCLESGKFYVIKPNLVSYLYKDFKIGENDCYSLVRNYYKQQLSINLNNYKREENWHINNPDLILRNFENEGFELIDGEMRINDLILFGKNKQAYHMGIYLENNMFIHHPRERKSVIEDLNHWKNKIVLILRHKTLL